MHVAVAVPPEVRTADVQPDTVTPAGVEVPANVTVPAKPFKLLTVIVVVPVAPLLKLLLVADMENPGCTPLLTVTLTVVEFRIALFVPAVLLMKTVKDPALVPVKVQEPDAEPPAVVMLRLAGQVAVSNVVIPVAFLTVVVMPTLPVKPRVV